MENVQQLKLNTSNEKAKSCLFTGHRDLGYDFRKTDLQSHIQQAAKDGVTDFYVGMAKGFDLLCAETVLEVKKSYPFIRLIACIPCYNQEKNYSQEDKKRYVDILKKVDEKVILSDNYYRGCMQNRDKYMADRGDMLICYCRKETGGTAYTLKYFQKKKPTGKVIFL